MKKPYSGVDKNSGFNNYDSNREYEENLKFDHNDELINI